MDGILLFEQSLNGLQFGLMLFHFGFINLPKSGDDDKITHASTTRRAAVE